MATINKAGIDMYEGHGEEMSPRINNGFASSAIETNSTTILPLG